MAFLEFKDVRIAGISAGVPKNVASNLHPTDQDNISHDYSPEEYVKTTGVEERRVSHVLTTADLSYAAAEKLIADLGWDKEEIGALCCGTRISGSRCLFFWKRFTERLES